jgi:8-oxo-dGTP pyrophosphatase MutT (NUDIX family)
MDEKPNPQEPVRKDVATSVILNKGRILILKRSQKVGTYQGKWACASGYIEAGETPRQTAYKEISEELGLGEEDVKLLKEGDVLFARDEDLLWAIHPFLFEIKRSELVLDWEHDEYKWIYPDELENYSCVPNLKETVYSVI